jgi:N-acetylglucosaminyldiphosphoundecaprenol N-acetyl-beta-D-mannosaminyltransferase
MGVAAGRRRIRLHGLQIDALTEAGTIAAILGALDERRGGCVVTPNLDHVRQFAQRPELRPIFERADLVVADGMPLVWASRLQGTPLPERVAGSDLVWSLTAEAALHGRSVFLLGGAPGASEAAEARLRALYPGARIGGRLSPPLGFERDPAEMERIRRALVEAQPDIVYVALGFPKQERLIAYLRPDFPHAWFLGVGFSLSFIAGEAARAPAWMIRLGLEWTHRMAQEPRRLAKRYLVHDLPFALRLFGRAAAVRLRLRPRRRRDAPARDEPRDAGPGARDEERVVFAHGALERERARLLEELLRPD